MANADLATPLNPPHAEAKGLQPSFPVALERLLLVIFLFLGLLIRLYDLDDPPLDFHPARQLFSALKARGMYYAAHPGLLPEWQQRLALEQRKLLPTIEPEILEHLVAWTYSWSGGEALWVARVYSSVFWVIGGLFLWLLVRRRFSAPTALVALAGFLFTPYSVIASRSFQPDPLMVTLLIGAWWALDGWAARPGWKWTLLSALLGGLVILVKFPAAFFLYPPLLLLLFEWRSPSRWRRPLPLPRLRGNRGQGLVLALLMALPSLVYLGYGLWVAGFLRPQLGGRFFPELWLQPLTYLQWVQEANRAAGALLIALGLLGWAGELSWLRPGEPTPSEHGLLVSGLWLGYLAYGFTFTHHITTHDYYHLPLIPLVAFSAASLWESIWPGVWARFFQVKRKAFDLHACSANACICVLLLRLGITVLALAYALFGLLWGIRSQLKAADYRPQAAMWAEIGEKLGHQPGVIALTPDYGLSLAYWGWQNAQVWPSSADLLYQGRGQMPDVDALFDRLTAGKRFFLIADEADFQRQVRLKARLSAFRIYQQGEGYLIYQLTP